ncbi:MAG: hypothetical protein E6618_10535 [Staphylococcus warneri]|nr:hypothetical protein [Staphylococcus lugdunensis]MDU6254629.1 hypothetical protein [Staphylococcus warneri]
MSINKVDIGYFEFLKESFNADLIVTGITVSIFAVLVFSIFFLSVEKIKLSSSFILHSIVVPPLVFGVTIFGLTMNYLLVKDKIYETKGYTKVTEVENFKPKVDDRDTIEQKIYFKDTKNELYVINSRHSKNIESGDKISLENNKNINIENHKIRDNDFLDISIIKK